MATVVSNTDPGLHLSSLTIGQVYRLTSSGGPWQPHGISGGTDDSWNFQISNDGTTWSSTIVAGDGTANYAPAWVHGRANILPHSVALDFVAATPELYVRVADNVFTDNTGSLTVTLEMVGAYCPYGTRELPGANITRTLTQIQIDAILSRVPQLGFFGPAFMNFVGWAYPTDQDCSQTPPPMPTFDSSDFIGDTGLPSPASLSKFWRALKIVSWPYFCECVPGAIGDPLPIEPLPPSQPLPDPRYPVLPGPTPCDNNDICETLNRIVSILEHLQQQVTYIRNDVNYIQNINAPISYTDNTTTTITGSGGDAALGILGVRVEFTSVPAGWGLSSDNPPRYIPAPASVSFMTADGGVLETMWCNEPVQTLVPHNSQLVASYTYALKPGVEATLTPLAQLYPAS